MPATFPELIRSFIDRRNLSVEQLATLANLSRKSVLQKLGVQMPFPISEYIPHRIRFYETVVVKTLSLSLVDLDH